MCTQVAGGVDFILKNLQAFNVSTMKSVITMDMVGYDGFPQLACVEDCISHCKQPSHAQDLVPKRNIDLHSDSFMETSLRSPHFPWLCLLVLCTMVLS